MSEATATLPDVKQKKARTRPKTREEYTLEQLAKHFPDGEWVTPQEGEAEVVDALGRDPSGTGFESPTPLSVAVIGGTKYDAASLLGYMRELPKGTTVYVGAGRGVESDLVKNSHELPLQFVLVDVDEERFGKHARKVNVPEVLIQDLASPIILVGSGERVKQAQSWLKMVEGQRDEANRRKVVELP